LLEPFLAKNKIAKIARAVRRISISELYQPISILYRRIIGYLPTKARLAGIEPATYCLEVGRLSKSAQSPNSRHCLRNISRQMLYQTDLQELLLQVIRIKNRGVLPTPPFLISFNSC